MNTPDDFTSARVAILGLGLMGGSLAMALHGRCAGLFGVDIDPQVVIQAQKLGIFNQISTRPQEILPQADVLVLAAPVRAILSLLEQLPAWHPGFAVVLDLGSTKAEIVAAMRSLPERFDPVGGHPMCGKEHGTIANAEASLFNGAAFALAALSRTSPRARRLVEQLVQTVGANPLWLTADVHDRWVAATSHAPYVIANALAASTPVDARSLIGPGWRSAARLAATPLNIILDMLSTNRNFVLSSLREFQSHLDELVTCLESDDLVRLQSALETGRNRYKKNIS